MVSCSGFGLPMHARLLRLFVTVMVGIDVAAQTTAGNPKMTLQDGEPVHERRPLTRIGSTLARSKAAALEGSTQRAGASGVSCSTV